MSDPFLGEIIMFAGNFPPRNWALCDGQLLDISTNTALFSLLGTTYGGDGRTTFALPDLRGRIPVHAGDGPGVSNRPLGSEFGSETETLSISEIPEHTHNLSSYSGVGNSNEATGNYFAKSSIAGRQIDSYHSSDSDGAPVLQSNIAGNNTAHNNMQPYLGLNFIIALTGVFPSRN